MTSYRKRCLSAPAFRRSKLRLYGLRRHAAVIAYNNDMLLPRTPMKDRLIVALDVPNARAAQEMVARIGEAAVFYKVGLQLFTAEGPAIVRELIASGRRVFLDLKLHDIPNTVAHAVKSATALGAHMLTLHAGGGSDMLRAAVEAADHRLKLLAVTVLTSMDPEDRNGS